MYATNAECEETIAAIPAVQQTEFYGKHICGKRGGPSFAEVQRVQLNTPECGSRDSICNCPEGLAKCSEMTSPENTLCYPPADLSNCPIIEMKFVTSEEVVRYRTGSRRLQEDAGSTNENASNGEEGAGS